MPRISTLLSLAAIAGVSAVGLFSPSITPAYVPAQSSGKARTETQVSSGLLFGKMKMSSGGVSLASAK